MEKTVLYENIDRLVTMRDTTYHVTGKHPGYKKYSGK